MVHTTEKLPTEIGGFSVFNLYIVYIFSYHNVLHRYIQNLLRYGMVSKKST